MTQPLQTRCVKEALARVRHLFVDTREVTLTAADVARMAGLDSEVCQALLRNLLDTGFLEQRPGGLFARRTSASRSP